MNPRNTFLLVLLAAGLFAFIYFYERHLNFTPPPPSKLLSGFDAAAVTNIQVQLRGQEEIRAERTTNGTWQLTKPIVYPAQSLAVEYLLKALQDLLPQNHISAQELKGKRNVNADYGFETPLVTIVATLQGDEQRQLKLGNLTAPGNQVYAQVVGSDGVDIIGTDFFQYIPRQPDNWRDTAFLNLQGRIFDHITVTNGARTFALQGDGTNSSWHMVPHERVNISRLAGLFNQLQALRVVRFETDNPKADLEPYGLQPPELELDFDQGTNHLITLQFGKSPTNDPGLVYARRDGQSSVVLVQADLVKGWRADKIEFRDRTLAGMYTWVPDEIDVSGRANFTVRRVLNDAWRVTAPYDFPADTNLIKQFIAKLARLSVVPTNGPVAVKDIVPPSEWTNYGLASPAWKYVLKDKLTNAPSGVSNVVMAEIDFGAVSNNDTIFARRPEEPSVYAVALADFQQLPVSGIQLHERRIWDFTEDQVGRIIIQQDGIPMELIHKAANDWALGAGSQGIINPLAVEVGAQELGVLAAEDFVARGGEKKADYGFTEKSLQISVLVGKAGTAEMLTVEFGGRSPRGLRYGLVELNGQKWIFEFPAIVHDRLMSYFNIH
jgi:hypothetical protein